MKTRINAIIGLLLMMAGLFSLAVLLTSCSKEEELANFNEPEPRSLREQGFNPTGDGKWEKNGVTAISDTISYSSRYFGITFVGYTEDFDHRPELKDFKYNGFSDSKNEIKAEIEKMLEDQAPGANYVYLYNTKEQEITKNDSAITYYITYEEKGNKSKPYNEFVTQSDGKTIICELPDVTLVFSRNEKYTNKEIAEIAYMNDIDNLEKDYSLRLCIDGVYTYPMGEEAYNENVRNIAIRDYLRSFTKSFEELLDATEYDRYVYEVINNFGKEYQAGILIKTEGTYKQLYSYYNDYTLWWFENNK